MGYRIVRLSRQLFEQMFVEGYTQPGGDNMRLVCTKGLPAGVRLDAVSMDLFFDSNGIALRFYHPDWPDEPAGCAILEERIEYMMHHTTEFHRWMLPTLTAQERAELIAQLEEQAQPTGAVPDAVVDGIADACGAE